ncbi:hypothetical protein AB6F08_10460, partial [Staphylococcus saprophyticus]|uniref:hypothetical protein n=1 Tax=Staphylococcus saprophyticus TaxID=29385 RepID=UPI0034DD9615
IGSPNTSFIIPVILFINFPLNEKVLFIPDKLNPRAIVVPNIPEAANGKANATFPICFKVFDDVL